MSVIATYNLPHKVAALAKRVQTAPSLPPAEVGIHRRVRYGLRAFAFGAVIALLWAALVPISGAVMAPGAVTVRGERKAVQHLEGGIVSAIYVEDGQRVDEGQPLLQMSAVQPGATVGELRHHLAETAVREARLSAELAGDKSFSLGADVLDAMNGNDGADIERLILSEMQLQQERATNQTSLTSQAESNIQATQAKITGVKAELSSTLKQKELIEEELRSIRTLYQEGYATLTRVLAYERSLAELTGRAAKAEATLAEYDQLLRQQAVTLSQIQTDFRRSVLEELSQVRVELKGLQERWKAANDIFGRTTLKAPSAGVVMSMAVHGVGEVVSSGAVLMEIVPQDQGLVVEARVRPEDIEQVKSGMPARLQFGAYRNLRRDLVEGHVAYVGADAVDDVRTGERYFTARIVVNEDAAAEALDLALQPGMPVTAFIETEKRTAFAYLLSPLSNVLLRSLRE